MQVDILTNLYYNILCLLKIKHNKQKNVSKQKQKALDNDYYPNSPCSGNSTPTSSNPCDATGFTDLFFPIL
jgi:hypothetical protein